MNRSILRLALPAIVSNITVPLLGMADTAIVGHMGNPTFLAAIALGSTAFSMIYWVFGFLRMSTSGLVAQAYGAADEVMLRTVLRKSLMLSLLLSMLLLALQVPLFHVATWLMAARADALSEFQTYFYCCIWGAPAMLLNYSLAGYFVGRQDTRTPMVSAIVQNVANILFSLLFVYALGWGIAGVALGTVLGAYVGTLLMASRLQGAWRRITHAEAPTQASYGLLRTNGNIFLRTLCLVAVSVSFTRAGSEQVAGVLEANALLMQLFVLFSFFADGFANAGEALAGRFWGAGNHANLCLTIRSLMLWGLGIAIFFALGYGICGKTILAVLTNQESILLVASDYLPWLCLMPLFSFSAFVWDGIFIGLARAHEMLRSMFVAMVVFFVLWYALRDMLENHALWLAFDSYLLLRGLGQWWMARDLIK